MNNFKFEPFAWLGVVTKWLNLLTTYGVHGLALKYLFGPLWFYLNLHARFLDDLPYMDIIRECVNGRLVLQCTAPLVPRVKGAGDTRHFQDYEEKRDVFKIKAENMHAKDFEDF